MKALCQTCENSKKCPVPESGVYVSDVYLEYLPEVEDYFGESDLPVVTELITLCSKYVKWMRQE